VYKVINKIKIGEKWSVSLEGDSSLIHNGLILIDELGNKYTIEAVALVHYKDVNDIGRKLEVMLNGHVEDIGYTLKII
jgi:hypothetical protein